MMIIKPVKQEIEKKIVVREPGDIIGFLYEFYTDLVETENISVLSLDAAHQVISIRVVSSGTIAKAIVHPREIFRGAILDNAAAIIMVHNHPSGVSIPSEADLDMTRRIKEASELLGITLLDHIILGEEYYSFLEHKNII